MHNTDIMRKYADILKEGYERDYNEEYSEKEFFADIEDWYEYNETTQHGEGDGKRIKVEGNEVYHETFGDTDRHMGTLESRGGNMIVMRGSYGPRSQNELIGAIVKTAGPRLDVFFYQPGYVGSSENLKAALDTLIIAAWG